MYHRYTEQEACQLALPIANNFGGYLGTYLLGRQGYHNHNLERHDKAIFPLCPPRQPGGEQQLELQPVYTLVL